MLASLERGDPMVGKTRRTAPHRDIPAFHAKATQGIGAAFPSPQENRRQAQRNRYDWSPLVILIAILMQAEF